MKKTHPRRRAQHIEVTPEQRYHMINDAAYFRAIKENLDQGAIDDQAQPWCEVEAEIDAVLKKRHAG